MKRVYWTTQELMKNLNKVMHLRTGVHSVEGSQHPERGSTVWGGELAGQGFAIAWDWSEVRGRTVALADPMCVLSNVMLVEDDGLVMDQGQKLLHLNTAVYCLRWQRVVMARYTHSEERLAA